MVAFLFFIFGPVSCLVLLGKENKRKSALCGTQKNRSLRNEYPANRSILFL